MSLDSVQRTFVAPQQNRHPVAWWGWSLLLASVATFTLNPFVNLSIVAVVFLTVYTCRTDSPWALAFRLYVYLAVSLFTLRVLWRLIFAGPYSGTTILVPLPGFHLLGLNLLTSITAENLLAGITDGLRLATIVLCIGAANTLANPRRLLRSLPKALQEVGTALTIALSVFPQLAEATARITQARAYRSQDRLTLVTAFRQVAVPVLQDALDSSLTLAASMSVRGYESRRRSRFIQWCVVATAAFLVVALYFLLSPATQHIGYAYLLLSAGLLCLTLYIGSINIHTTRFRPDLFRPSDALIITTALPAFLCALLLPSNQSPAAVVLLIQVSAVLLALLSIPTHKATS